MKKILWAVVAVVAMAGVVSCNKTESASERFLGNYEVTFEPVKVPILGEVPLISKLLPDGKMEVTKDYTNFLGLGKESVRLWFTYEALGIPVSVPLLTATVDGDNLSFPMSKITDLSIYSLLPAGIQELLRSESTEEGIVLGGTGVLVNGRDIQLNLKIDGIKFEGVSLDELPVKGYATRK